MHAFELYRLARDLREIALATIANPDESTASVGELAIVEDVARHPDAPIRDIAARTGLAQSFVSQTVAAARDRGIFTTEIDPADRRRSLVRMDQDARREVDEERGSRSVLPELQRALEGTDPSTIERIAGTLDELATLLAVRRPAVAP